jgi:type IX secretion system PorP/SprF family membrane protein
MVQSVLSDKKLLIMRKFSFIILSTLFSGIVLAQQEYQFSNSAYNPFMLNPAAGGLTDVMHFEVSSRLQWMGYDGGPQTFMASGNSQFTFKKKKDNVLSEFNSEGSKLFEAPKVTVAKKKHIVGGKVWNDAIGPFAKTSFQGSYAYHLPLTKKLNFGVGVGLGISNFRVNESKVKLYQSDDATYSQFLGNASQQTLGDAQAGLVVYGERFYFGLSTTQLLQNNVVLNDIVTESNYNRHFFAMMRYKFGLTKTLALEPSFVLKSVANSPASYDLGARLLSKNRMWASLQYRSGNTVIFQLGSNLIMNMYVAYSYEHSSGKIRAASNGTHELQLGWYIGKNRDIEQELKEKDKEKGTKVSSSGDKE